jgi:hypothetical protein
VGLVCHTETFNEQKSRVIGLATYTQTVRANILPRSVAGTLPAAFLEWYFTGWHEDHGAPIETCQLCGKEELRYHFEIKNQHTNSSLLVGSHCILKFDVAIYEDERKLSPHEAKKKLAAITKQMHVDSCVSALERLATAEKNPILTNTLDYFKKNKMLTPKQANVIFWRLTENRIDHNPSFFSINLKKQQLRDDLRDMPTARVHRFWRAMTIAQRKLAESLGHAPPTKPNSK